MAAQEGGKAARGSTSSDPHPDDYEAEMKETDNRRQQQKRLFIALVVIVIILVLAVIALLVALIVQVEKKPQKTTGPTQQPIQLTEQPYYFVMQDANGSYDPALQNPQTKLYTSTQQHYEQTLAQSLKTAVPGFVQVIVNGFAPPASAAMFPLRFSRELDDPPHGLQVIGTVMLSATATKADIPATIKNTIQNAGNFTVHGDVSQNPQASCAALTQPTVTPPRTAATPGAPTAPPTTAGPVIPTGGTTAEPAGGTTGAVPQTTETNVPPGTQTVLPPGTQTAAPPGTQTAAPPGTQTVAPPGTQTAAPPGTQTAAPPGTQTVAPPGTQTAAPPGTQTAAPPGTQTAAPPGTQTVAPPGTQTAAPPGTQTAAPPGTQTPAPPGTQTAAPPGTQTAAPPATAGGTSLPPAPTTTPYFFTNPTSQPCPVLDLVYLVDESESEVKDQFSQVKVKLIELTKNFEIGPNATQIAMAWFSDVAGVEFYLNTHETNDSVINAINNAQQTPGATATSDGLRLVKDDVLKAGNGERPHARQVVIVFTDGESNIDTFDMPAASADLKKVAPVIVAGYDEELTPAGWKEMELMATNSSFIYNATNAADIDINKILFILDSFLFCAPTPPPTLVPCPAHLDIVLLLDRSESVPVEGFKMAQSFLTSLVTGWSVAPGLVRVGLVVYDTNAFSQIILSSDAAAVTKAINAVNPPKFGYTAIGRALNEAENQFNNNPRPEAGRVIIVVSNGNNNEPPDPVPIAQQLRQQDTLILAVGIGFSSNPGLQDQLANITGSAKLVFAVNDYSVLSDDVLLMQQLQFLSCAQLPPTFPTTTPGPTQCTEQCSTQCSTVCYTEITTVTTVQPTTAPPSCNIDLIFVIDDSESVGPDNFNLMKEFMINITSGFVVASQYTKVAVVKFSSVLKTRTIFELNTYDTNDKVNAAITGMLYEPGATATGTALNLVLTDVMQAGNGYRADKPNVIILMTDGGWNVGPDPVPQAQQIRAQGAEIISIGIGKDIVYDELASISGSVSLVYNITGFSDLTNRLQGEIVNQSCIQPTIPTTPPPITTVPPTTCRSPAFDIVYIIDESESVGEDNFNNEIKPFLVQLTEGFSRGSDENIRAAFVWFSQTCGVEFYLNTYNATNAIELGINNAPYHVGASYLSCALNLARQTVLTPAAGDRPGIPNVIFLMTDGGWNLGTDPVPIAQHMRVEDNDEIWVIAIQSQDIQMNTLIDITGDVNHILNVTDFSALSEAVNKTLAEFPDPCPPPPCIPDPIDIVFLIDESESIEPEEFALLKQFLANVTDGLSANIEADMHYALAWFSQTAGIEFNLDKFTKETDVTNAILNAQQNVGATNMQAGFQIVHDHVFGTAGDRPNVPNVVVLVSDGKPNLPTAGTAIQAAEAAADSVRIDYKATIYSVGITSDVDNGTLIHVTGGYVNQFFYTPTFDLAHLAPIVTQLTRNLNSCYRGPTEPPRTIPPVTTQPVTTQPPTTPVPIPGQDIAILLNDASCITAENFNCALQFISSLVGLFPAIGSGYQETQFAVATYADESDFDICFNQYSNRMQLQDLIANVFFHGGPSSDINTGIDVLLEEIFVPTCGNRMYPAYDNVTIVIDMCPFDSTKPDVSSLAEQLRDSLVTVFAIGIGVQAPTQADQLKLTGDNSRILHFDDVCGANTLPSARLMYNKLPQPLPYTGPTTTTLPTTTPATTTAPTTAGTTTPGTTMTSQSTTPQFCGLDVVYIVDVSNNLQSQSNCDALKASLTANVQSMDLSVDRVAVIGYGAEDYKYQCYTSDLTLLTSSIQDIRCHLEDTTADPAQAFNAVNEPDFCGTSACHKQQIIFFAFAVPPPPQLNTLVPIVQGLRSKGYNFAAVGIPGTHDSPTTMSSFLANITGNPSSTAVAGNFTDFQSKSRQVVHDLPHFTLPPQPSTALQTEATTQEAQTASAQTTAETEQSSTAQGVQTTANGQTEGQTTTAAEVGTTAAGVGTTAAEVGTTAAGAGTTAAEVGTTAAEVGTTAAEVGTTAAEVGTTAAEVGTTAAEVGTTAAGAGTTAAEVGTTAAEVGTTAAGQQSSTAQGPQTTEAGLTTTGQTEGAQTGTTSMQSTEAQPGTATVQTTVAGEGTTGAGEQTTTSQQSTSGGGTTATMRPVVGVDVVVVVDVSSCIGSKANCLYIEEFIQAIAATYSFPEDQLALMTYDTSVISTCLNDSTTLGAVNNMIQSIILQGCQANTGSDMATALQDLISNVFVPSCGNRPDADDEVILFACSLPTDTSRLPAAAKAALSLQNNGTTLYGAGFSNNPTVLSSITNFVGQRIVSNPNNFVTTTDITTLKSVGTKVANFAPHPTGPPCATPLVDLVFLLDESESVGQRNFETLKSFVWNLTDSVISDYTQGHVALAWFSTSVGIEFNLNKYNTRSGVAEGIFGAQYNLGITNIGLGLENVQSVFDGQRRPNSNKILILITDGMWNTGPDPVPIATQLRGSEVAIYGIGITNDANMTELRAITGKPANTFAATTYELNNDIFTQLQSVINPLCYPPSSQQPPCIPAATDFVFLVDESESIGIDNFNTIKAFLKQIVQALSNDIDSVDTNIGMAYFSDFGDMEFDLTANYATIQTKIDAARYNLGITNTASGLQVVQEQIFGGVNDRPVAPNKLLVITDGRWNTGADPSTIAANMQAQGVEIIAIGIGDDIDYADLASIASRVFTISDCSELESQVVTELVRMINQCYTGAVTTPRAAPPKLWGF